MKFKSLLARTFFGLFLFAYQYAIADGYPEPKVVDKNHWGYVNSFGYFVIQPEFTMARPFHTPGLAYVEKNGKAGYIDVNGKFAIPPAYDNIEESVNDSGLLAVRNGGGFLGNDADARYGFVNLKGELVVPIKYERVGAFAGLGLCPVAISSNDKSGTRLKYGYVDKQGNVAIPMKFDYARGFDSSGFAAAELDHKFGFINSKGEFVIPPKYDDIGPERIWTKAGQTLNNGFDRFGLTSVRYNGMWRVINRAGETIGPDDFEQPIIFQENGTAIVVRRNGFGTSKYGVIDTSGRFIFPPQFDGIEAYENGFALILDGQNYGYIDSTGHIIIKPQFALRGGSFDKNGIVRVTSVANGRVEVGYMNTKGEWIVKPNQFKHFDNNYINFSANGFAPIVLDDYDHAYLNVRGEVTLRGFEDTRDFAPNGFAAVKKDGKFGYIDATGTIVIEPQFEDAMIFAENGLAGAKIDGKWGYIDIHGHFVVAPKFDLVWKFRNDGTARVKLNGKWGNISLAKDFVPEPSY